MTVTDYDNLRTLNPNYQTSEFINDKVMEHLKDLEMAFLFGQKKAGSDRSYTMDGAIELAKR